MPHSSATSPATAKPADNPLAAEKIEKFTYHTPPNLTSGVWKIFKVQKDKDGNSTNVVSKALLDPSGGLPPFHFTVLAVV